MTFWILAPIMVLAALGILFVRKAVHAALLLAVVMISLAVLYAVLEAPFLFAVQIIVYTGAILMLFLFVLMLVGVDASDSVVETIRGQRVLAIVGGLALGVTLVVGIAQTTLGATVGMSKANAGGNIQALANLLWAAATLHYTPSEAWMAAFDCQLARHITSLTPAHVAMTVWALSRLQWLPGQQLWQQLQERAELHSASYCLRSQRMLERAVRVLQNVEEEEGDEEEEGRA